MKKYFGLVVLALLVLSACAAEDDGAAIPTTNPADAYVQVIRPDTSAIEGDMTSAQADCGVNNSDACYTDMQTLSDDVHRAQQDLKAVTVPSCMADFDTNLRTALNLLDKSAQSAMNGIEQDDSFLLDTAGSYMQQAGRYLGDANDSLKSANC